MLFSCVIWFHNHIKFAELHAPMRPQAWNMNQRKPFHLMRRIFQNLKKSGCTKSAWSEATLWITVHVYKQTIKHVRVHCSYNPEYKVYTVGTLSHANYRNTSNELLIDTVRSNHTHTVHVLLTLSRDALTRLSQLDPYLHCGSSLFHLFYQSPTVI